MLDQMKQQWDLIKIVMACALSAGGAAAGAGKLVARAEVATVEARVNEHLQPGVIHEEAARRIGAVGAELNTQLRAVDAKAEAAARDAYASRVMLEALLVERGITVPPGAPRSATPPPAAPLPRVAPGPVLTP